MNQERTLRRANHLMILLTIADVIVIVMQLSQGLIISAVESLAIIAGAWWFYA